MLEPPTIGSGASIRFGSAFCDGGWGAGADFLDGLELAAGKKCVCVAPPE